MTLKSGFFNSSGSDRVYDAEDFSRYLEGIISNGCFPTDIGFLATANPDPILTDPPSIIISPGKTYLDGLWLHNSANYVFALDTAQQIENGKYSVYFCFDTNEAARTVTIESDFSTSSAFTVPEDGAGKFYLPLAHVSYTVATQPIAGDIIDHRQAAGVTAINVSLANLQSEVTNRLMPVGAISQYAGATAPVGFLLCQGQAISRTGTYADLFAAIGTVYGAGDGSTTFNVPDLQGRVPVGFKSSDTAFDALNETGGSKDAVTVAHTHIQQLNSADNGQGVPTAMVGGVDVAPNRAGTFVVDVTNTAGSQRPFVSTQSTGVAATNQNLQPYIVLNYIIAY